MTKPARSSIEEVRQRIRGAGLRSTAPRIAVYLKLEESKRPVSHSELADFLADQGFDKATVYRNLMDLSEAGIAARRDLGDHVWRFELLREGEEAIHQHPHFMCETCGEVVCLPEVTVAISPAAGKKQPAFGSVSEVLLKGVCGRCK